MKHTDTHHDRYIYVIDALNLLFKEADIILFNYPAPNGSHWSLGEENKPSYKMLLRCNFYDKWIRRCVGNIDMLYWKLQLEP